MTEMFTESLFYEVYAYENGIATIQSRCRRMYDALSVLNQQTDGGFIMDENGNEVARTGTVPVVEPTGPPIEDEDVSEGS